MSGIPAYPPEMPDTPTTPDIPGSVPPEWPAGDPQEQPDVGPPMEDPGMPDEMPAQMDGYTPFQVRYFLNPTNFPVR